MVDRIGFILYAFKLVIIRVVGFIKVILDAVAKIINNSELFCGEEWIFEVEASG